MKKNTKKDKATQADDDDITADQFCNVCMDETEIAGLEGFLRQPPDGIHPPRARSNDSALQNMSWTLPLSAQYDMTALPSSSLIASWPQLPQPKSPMGHLDPYDSQEEIGMKKYVGFSTLPNQIQRKSVRKGFEFTLMVVGESGLGKSTLVNSLFLTDLYKDRKVPDAEEKIAQTVSITKKTVSIEEKGVRLRLTVVDTPGFGDSLNNEGSWEQVSDFIDQQFEQYRRNEISLSRQNIQDSRVHCCLYFISPFGHGLKPLDVECMRALHEKVNLVPVLAKADSVTQDEVKVKKARILNEIENLEIKIYQFPNADSDDEVFLRQDLEMKRSIPFAVVGSNCIVDCDGRRVRARVYPWGLVDVENPVHSDFELLRNMLVTTHMQDLKDVTHEIHYENYRAGVYRRNYERFHPVQQTEVIKMVPGTE